MVPREADLEVVHRLAAVRLVADQVVTGRWLASPELVDALADLTATAASWARRAAA